MLHLACTYIHTYVHGESENVSVRERERVSVGERGGRGKEKSKFILLEYVLLVRT